MKYLIDTHVSLWWWADDPQLPPKVRAILSDKDNTIYFSAISAYEILFKEKIGKLTLPKALSNNLDHEVSEAGWKALPLNLTASALAAQFSTEHRDPFDRFLAAQSQHHQLPVISIDSTLDLFTVKRVWE